MTCVDGQEKCPPKWPAQISPVVGPMLSDHHVLAAERLTGGLTASMYFFAVSRWMPSSRATPRIDSPLRFAFWTSQRLPRPLKLPCVGMPCEEDPSKFSQQAWAWWDRLAGDDLSLVTHNQLDIRVFQHIYHRSCITAPLRPQQQLERTPPVLHSVVPDHPAAVPGTEESVEAQSRPQRTVKHLHDYFAFQIGNGRVPSGFFPIMFP